MKLVNFYEHPVNNTFMVYEYQRKDMAEEFKRMLEEHNISYEEGLDDDNPNKILFLFGVKKTHRKLASKLNYLTYAKYRRPLISNTFLKYLLIIFVLGVITLAIVGYNLSKH